MRRPTAVVMSVTLAVLAWGSATLRAADHDGTYTGLIMCDAIPGLTMGPLRTQFRMEVRAGDVRYEREVLRADTSATSGIVERGTGTLSPSGEVSLTGGAAGGTFTYAAAYRGTLAGGRIQLAGTQEWRTKAGGAHSRPCTIALDRTNR